MKKDENFFANKLKKSGGGHMEFSALEKRQIEHIKKGNYDSFWARIHVRDDMRAWLYWGLLYAPVYILLKIGLAKISVSSDFWLSCLLIISLSLIRVKYQQEFLMRKILDKLDEQKVKVTF